MFLHSGFIYSYLIVIVLILAWNQFRAGKAVLLEKRRWIPRKYQGFRFCGHNWRNLFAALASSTGGLVGQRWHHLAHQTGLLCCSRHWSIYLWEPPSF